MKKKNCLFGMVYEFFSHGVYSLDMMFAFAYPLLVIGASAYPISRLIKKEKEA